MPQHLTARQQQMLDVIAAYRREHGYPPTTREIGAAMGIRSPNGVHTHLKVLVRKGFIKRVPHASRGIQLVPQQSQASVTDQLRELIPVADKMGLYDAGDYLRNAVEPRNDEQTEDA